MKVISFVMLIIVIAVSFIYPTNAESNLNVYNPAWRTNQFKAISAYERIIKHVSTLEEYVKVSNNLRKCIAEYNIHSALNLEHTIGSDLPVFISIFDLSENGLTWYSDN